MRNRWMAAALLAVACAWAVPAAAQTHTRMHSEITDNGRRISVDANGEVRFTDDDAGVAYLEPGGRLVIEESTRGQPDRRVEYRGTDRGVRRTFWRDGERTEPNGADQAWIRRALLQPIRESGLNADERAARIYRRGGVDAVLDEIRQIGSDGTKSRYYIALLRQPLRPGDRARVLADAGHRIGSDGDKTRVLMTLLERPSATNEEMEAMLNASTRIGSDGDRSRLLIATAERNALGDGEVRDAFFRAATQIGSDGDKSRVLIATLDRSRARRDVVLAAIRAARTIGSDGDKTRVLTSIPSTWLRDGEVVDAYRSTLRTIGSDGDRGRAAARLYGSAL